MQNQQVERESVTVEATDGYELAARRFSARDRRPRGVVIINGATGVTQRFYRRFAEMLAGAGYVAVTYDYRGVGESSPDSLRGFSAYLEHWARDYAGVVKWARDEHPEQPVAVIGHSIGGVLLGFEECSAQLDAVLTVAAGTAYYGDRPFGRRLATRVTNTALHGLALAFGYLPASKLRAGEDLPTGIVEELSWRARYPDFRAQIAARGLTPNFDQVRAPLLSIGISDDSESTPAAIDRLHRLYSSAEIEMIELGSVDDSSDAIGHFGFFRARHEDTMWPHATRWLERALPRRAIRHDAWTSAASMRL